MNRLLRHAAWEWALAGLLALVVGCGKPQTGDENHVDSVAVSVPKPDVPRSSALGADSLELVPFDAKSLPSSARHEGDIADGAHWRDRDGEHWLVISERQHGMVADEDFLLSIFGRCWKVGRDSLELQWEIKEFNQNVFSGPAYAAKTLEVMDLDQDGVAETAFMYTIDTDGAGPCGVKLLLHVHGKKYAIRGQLAGMDYDRGKVEEKHIDPAFKEIDPMFREFASKKWDAYEREFYKGWPEVEE